MLPTENVGSLPRPVKLQAAIADYDAKKISRADLEREQDEACKDSITRMEATGSTYVSDGEQRASSFATYPLTDTLAGTGLAPNLAGDGQYFAIFTDGTVASCHASPADRSSTRPTRRSTSRRR